VQDKAAADESIINEQLQKALTNRVVIEQAKGVIAQLGQMDMAQSFAVLRRYSRDHNEKLADIAAGVVARTLRPEDLIEYAQSRRAKRT
jgi:AmiR/NasT family two-component response regulator